MTLGLSAAAIGGIAVAAGGIGSALIGANAANSAANAQTQAAAMSVEEQKREFEAMKKLLAPYITAGTGSLTKQQDLLGVNGSEAQQAAIEGIKTSNHFEELNKQGQDAIMQNASATGGLRGGNVQGALAQYSPQLLNSMIQQQFQNLGGLTTMGANAAAGQGSAGMGMANQIGGLYQQSGAAQAGAYLAQGKAEQGGINSLIGGLGTFMGLGGKF